MDEEGKAEALAVIKQYPDGIPAHLVTSDILSILVGNECDHVHRGAEGPNEDIGWCYERQLPTFTMRLEGETFGEHLSDCSLPLRHGSYCVGGGQGHPKAAIIRGFWPEEPPTVESQQEPE